MKKPSRKLKIFAGALLATCIATLFLPGTPSESSIVDVEPSRHYQIVSDKPLTHDTVVLFFWYGCPHCLKVETILNDTGFYSDLESKGIKIRKAHAVMNKVWEFHARLFHALEIRGMSRKGHFDVMKRIQAHGIHDKGSLSAHLPRIVSAEKASNPQFKGTADDILELMYSESVHKRIVQDRNLAMDARLSGVPAVLVGGNALVTLSRQVTYIDLPVVVMKLLGTE